VYVTLQAVVPHVVPPPLLQALFPVPQVSHPSKWTAALPVVQSALGVI
jgi:hypothetical protein